MKTEIIRYKPEHRERVRQILWDTGFGGESMDGLFDDMDLLVDVNALYHTDYDWSHNFLAVADGEIAGYLLGCPDTKLYEKRMKEEVIPHILRKLAAGRYKITPRNLLFLRRSILCLLRGEAIAPPIDQYPAHLHIDFDARFRRIGLGTRIMRAYFDYLRGLGVGGVHLGTSSFHKSSLPFYRKLGFTIHARKRITEHFFLETTQEDMYNIIFVRKL